MSKYDWPPDYVDDGDDDKYIDFEDDDKSLYSCPFDDEEEDEDE
jgi:hypothetical protein